MTYLFVKTLHLFSILAWTAGLIYLPRLLAEVVADVEQVLITAAVGADVPDFPAERRFRVDAGIVSAL